MSPCRVTGAGARSANGWRWQRGNAVDMHLVELDATRTLHPERVRYFYGNLIGTDNAGDSGHFHYRVTGTTPTERERQWTPGVVEYVPVNEIHQITKVV